MTGQSFFFHLLDPTGFPARWNCGDWSAAHGWTHIVADLAIFGAYAAIPASIYYYLHTRGKVSLPSLWWLFGAFILSCGFTHLIDATIFWHPWYRFFTVAKVITAVVSWATVGAIFRNLPALMALPDLHELNRKLQASESSLSAMLDSIGDAVLATDTAGRVTRMNPVAETLTGWTQQAAAGHPIDEVFRIINEKTLEPAEIPVQRVLSTGRVMGLANHTVLIARDGRQTPIADSAAPILHGEEIMGTVLVFRDVSQEKEAERREKLRVAKTLRLQDCILRLRDSPQASLKEFLNQVPREVAEALSVDRVSLWLLPSDSSHATLTGTSGKGPEGNPVKVVDAGELLHHLKSQELLITTGGRQDPRVSNLISTRAPVGVLIAPIRRGDRQVGLLCIEHSDLKRDWTQEDLQFVISAASKTMLGLEQRERHRVEEELRSSEARFRTTFESAAIGLAHVATDGRWIRVNQLLCDFLGYSHDELLVTTFQAITHPDDLAKDLSLVQDCLDGKIRSYSMEKRYIRKNGEVIWGLLTVALIRDESGAALHFVSAVQDISQRKKAEEELAALNQGLTNLVEQRAAKLIESEQRFTDLFESAPDPMILTSPDGTIDQVNRQVELLFGTTRETLAGQPIELLFTNESAEVYRRQRSRCMAPRESETPAQENADLKARKSDGKEIPIQVNLSLLSVGEEHLVVTAIRDMTAWEIANRQTMRTQRLESIGRLAGGVAHDLNNALAPVVMGVDLLRGNCPPEADYTLDLIESSARHGSEMVRQLLDFARGAEGDRSKLHPQHLIRDIERLVRGTFPKNIELRMRLEKDLPILEGDSTQLHQLLLNLCVNARDAMPDGGTITITAERFECDHAFSAFVENAQPGEYLTIQVSDTGTGIPNDLLDRIFDPFFTTKSADQGTGLGLSTVVGVVKGHHGFMRVYSEVGKGSRFEVYLPVSEGEPAPPAPPEQSQVIDGRERLVLVVDDEGAIRRGLEMMLKRLNFQVVSAADGQEALEVFHPIRDSLALVITDVNMPNMDGPALARALHELAPELPIIAMSGLPDEQRWIDLQQSGAVEFMRKPFKIHDLVEALGTALR